MSATPVIRHTLSLTRALLNVLIYQMFLLLFSTARLAAQYQVNKKCLMCKSQCVI